MYVERTISHALAERAIAAMSQACMDANKRAVFAVVDRNGLLKAYLRHDGANIVSATVAQNKAVTAALLTCASGAVGSADELANFGDPRITHWAGGLPILVDGDCVGGIGVSGLTNEEDEDLARIGLAVIEAE